MEAERLFRLRKNRHVLFNEVDYCALHDATIKESIQKRRRKDEKGAYIYIRGYDRFGNSNVCDIYDVR